jgi:hypothetical protein
VHFAPQFLSGKAGASTCLADFIHCLTGELIMFTLFKNLARGELFHHRGNLYTKMGYGIALENRTGKKACIRHNAIVMIKPQ